MRTIYIPSNLLQTTSALLRVVGWQLGADTTIILAGCPSEPPALTEHQIQVLTEAAAGCVGESIQLRRIESYMRPRANKDPGIDICINVAHNSEHWLLGVSHLMADKSCVHGPWSIVYYDQTCVFYSSAQAAMPRLQAAGACADSIDRHPPADPLQGAPTGCASHRSVSSFETVLRCINASGIVQQRLDALASTTKSAFNRWHMLDLTGPLRWASLGLTTTFPGGISLANSSALASQLHCRLKDIGVRIPQGLSTVQACPGEYITPDFSVGRVWDVLDTVLRIAIDMALGIGLGWFIRAQAGADPQLRILQWAMHAHETLLLPSIQPWLNAVTGCVPPQGQGDLSTWLTTDSTEGGGAQGNLIGHKLALFVILAFKTWECISMLVVIPVLATSLPLVVSAVLIYGLGLSFLVAWAIDALDFCSVHLWFLATVCSTVYSRAGHVLLSLWRLFRGKKRNILRLRVDTLDAAHEQLLVGVLLFVPLFLLLPVLAAFYAAAQGLWIGVLTVRILLWWTLTALNNMAWARVIVRVLCPGVLPGGSVTVRFVGTDTEAQGMGEAVSYYVLHSHPPPLSALLFSPFREAWQHVSTRLGLTLRRLARAALTGATLQSTTL